MQGEEQRLTASNFLARVIQHEMDHLDGITFNTKIVGKMYKGHEFEKIPEVYG
jgi:peptide deformylase